METFIFCAVNKPNESISIASATQEVNEGCKLWMEMENSRARTYYRVPALCSFFKNNKKNNNVSYFPKFDRVLKT